MLTGTCLVLRRASPPLLPCEAFVEKSQDFRDIELDILEIKIFLIVLLHFKQIIELQVKF
jgi:hypothetical protein